MIPSNVNICGIPHKVVICKDSFDQDLHLGQIRYASAEIRINEDACHEMQMQTLIHEMLHGILVHIGRQEESNDEQLVQGLANAIYQSFDVREEKND